LANPNFFHFLGKRSEKENAMNLLEETLVDDEHKADD
jgi:hypothetical protein